jgi:CHASE2 domain-containing sensor protein
MLNTAIFSLVFVIIFFALWKLREYFHRLFCRTPFIKQKPYLHKYISNLLIGLGVLWLLNALQHIPFLMDAEDANLDLAMQLQSEIPALNDKPPFLLLDIDDKTHKEWGEPLFTPRHHIVELIDAAVKGGAKLVIVDVDLTQPTSLEGLSPFLPEDLELHPYDQKLYNYLAEYKIKHCQNQTCPPIILTRMSRSQLASHNKVGFLQEVGEITSGLFQPIPIPIQELRPSFLDNAAAQSAPYVQWASALFWESNYDGAIRRWWLWQAVCTEEQLPQIIPSIELLAATMVLLTEPQQAQENIDKVLSKFKPKFCTEDYSLPWISSSERLPIVKDLLEVTDGVRGIHQRIMYTMSWELPQSQNRKIPRYFLEDENGQEILTVFSAQPYLELKLALKIPITKDRIVVIGGSYSEGGDMHATSLIEEMPGGLIIINAIHSLLSNQGEIRPVDTLSKVLLVAIVTVVITWIFTFVSTFLRGLIVGIIALIIAIWMSILLLNVGIWINFALPLLAVEICEIMAKFEPQDKASPTQLYKVIRNSFDEITMRLNEVTARYPILSSQSQEIVTTLTELKPPPPSQTSLENKKVKKLEENVVLQKESV